MIRKLRITLQIFICFQFIKETHGYFCQPSGKLNGACYWIAEADANSEKLADDICRNENGQLANFESKDDISSESMDLEINGWGKAWVKKEENVNKDADTCWMMNNIWELIESPCFSETEHPVICETNKEKSRRKRRSDMDNSNLDTDWSTLVNGANGYSLSPCPSAMVAIQKSTWDRKHADLALDNDMATCAAMGYDSTPWWRVEFASQCRVQMVQLGLRIAQCGEKVSVKVLLADAINDRDERLLEDVHYSWVTVEKCSHNEPMFLQIQVDMDFRCSYLKLEFRDPNERYIQVHLCEVLVYGY